MPADVVIGGTAGIVSSRCRERSGREYTGKRVQRVRNSARRESGRVETYESSAVALANENRELVVLRVHLEVLAAPGRVCASKAHTRQDHAPRSAVSADSLNQTTHSGGRHQARRRKGSC